MAGILRIVGGLFLIIGLLNLAALFFIEDSGVLRSPAMVAFRYCLMCVFGLGFLVLRKWAALAFIGSVVANWTAYFVLYDGYGSLTPIWVAILVPFAIAVLVYLAWDDLT